MPAAILRPVPLAIDATHALRTMEQLEQLIRAVYTADNADESRAIEWKSGFHPITSTEASFMIAKTILGFANRPVPVATKDFEGVAYMLIGVEPGALHGQEVPDSAELLNAVRRYTGSGMTPVWDPRTIEVDGRIILVITVEAPRPGDRIALLRKAFQPTKGPLITEGTIFVRQPGATERATREDIEMLQDRLLDGAASNSLAIRELEQRREVLLWTAELIEAGTTWTQTMETLVISSAGRPWRSSDWAEWTTTDSGREQLAAVKTLHRNARKIRFFCKDPALRAAVDEAEATFDSTKNPKVFDVLHTPGDNPEGRREAYVQLHRIRAALAAVQAAATPLEVEAAEEPA